MRCQYCKKNKATCWWRGKYVCDICYNKLRVYRHLDLNDKRKLKKCWICKKLITNKDYVDYNCLCKECFNKFKNGNHYK